jgi:hypothetical protein
LSLGLPGCGHRKIAGVRSIEDDGGGHTGQTADRRSVTKGLHLGSGRFLDPKRSELFAENYEHHLNTVKRSPDAQNENWLFSIARKRPTKTPCSLLSIDRRFPKLDVAGSTPVSRSIFCLATLSKNPLPCLPC